MKEKVGIVIFTSNFLSEEYIAVNSETRAKKFDINLNLFSGTERRILEMLLDGKDHSKLELKTVMPDPEYATDPNLNNHLQRCRNKLRMMYYDIVCVNRNRKSFYRLVKSLADQDDDE